VDADLFIFSFVLHENASFLQVRTNVKTKVRKKEAEEETEEVDNEEGLGRVGGCEEEEQGRVGGCVVGILQRARLGAIIICTNIYLYL
jgi:hypothetical protein